MTGLLFDAHETTGIELLTSPADRNDRADASLAAIREHLVNLVKHRHDDQLDNEESHCAHL